MLRFLSTLLIVFLAACATTKPFRREDLPPPEGGITLPEPEEQEPAAIVLQVTVDERVVNALLNAARCTERTATFPDPYEPSRQVQFRYHFIGMDGDDAEVDFTGPDGNKRRVRVRRGELIDTGLRSNGRRILVQIR